MGAMSTNPRCADCDEECGPDDCTVKNGRGLHFHRDCLLRMVIGSAGHQRGACSCFGGTEEDPPGLSVREAARAAADYFRAHHPSGAL